MKALTVIGVLFGAMLIDVSFFASFNFFGVVPDMMLITVICFALCGGAFYGGLIGACGGLVIDLFTGMAMGIYGLLFMLMGIVAGNLGRFKFFTDNIFVPCILAAIMVLIRDLYMMVAMLTLSSPFSFFGTLVRATLPTMLVTAIFTLPLFAVYRRLHAARHMRIRRKSDQLDIV